MPDGIEFDIKFKIDEIETRMKHIEDSISDVANKTDRNTKKIGESFRKAGAEADKLDQSVRKIGDALMAYLTVNAVVGLAKGIIEVRSEFEKFTSVLTTAYGDVDKANRAMTMLKETAKETPFQLTELAQAFVLLKNRGVDPTKAALIKAGDFASSTGRTFQELSEALLNIGELEVWKKFGVNASLQGDKIKLSFRDLNMVVDKSTAGVLKAVEAFGSMKGIAGSMQGQMETLGGKVSNMKDAYDQLLNSLGESKAWKNSISWLTTFIEKTNDFFKGVEGRTADSATESINKFTDSLKGMTKVDAVKAINDRIGDLQKTASLMATNIKSDQKGLNWILPDKAAVERIKINQELLSETNKEIASLKKVVDVPWSQFEKWYDKMFSQTPPKPPALGLLEALNKQLKDFKAKREIVGNEAEIAIIDRQTEAIQKQIDKIEAGVKRINDANYNKKGPQITGPIKNTNLDKPIQFENNQVTGNVQLTMSPDKLTQINKDLAEINGIQSKNRINVDKETNTYILAGREKLLSDISELNRQELKERLQRLQAELLVQKGNADEQLKIYEKIDEVVKRIDDDVYNNISDISQAISNLGQTIGGDLGNSIQKMTSGFQGALSGFKAFNAEGASIGQKILGSVDLATGAYTAVMTLGNMATQLGEKLSGNADYEKQRAETLAKEKLLLQEMTAELQRQLELTKDIKGESRISGYSQLISEAKAGQQESLKALNQIMPYFSLPGQRGRMATAEFTIERWRNLVKYYDFSAELKAQLDEAIAKYDDFTRQIRDITNTQNAELTGSTYDSILTGIVDAFSDGTMSADEFASNFEGLMKKALLNSFSRDFLEKQLQGWYDSFSAASKGGLTSDEINSLRTSLQTITTNAQTGLQTLLNASGLDLSTQNTATSSAATGAIKNITEDSANLLNGQMNAIRINVIEQKNIALEGYQQLIKIETNTRPIAEIRDLLKANTNNSLINDRANGG